MGSLVSVAAATDMRRSKRLSQKASEAEAEATKVNGAPNGDSVEVGVDAMEIVQNGDSKPSSNGGLLERTMSKIWRIPEGITGVPYSDIQSADDSLVEAKEVPTTEAPKDTTDGKKASCVIS